MHCVQHIYRSSWNPFPTVLGHFVIDLPWSDCYNGFSSTWTHDFGNIEIIVKLNKYIDLKRISFNEFSIFLIQLFQDFREWHQIEIDKKIYHAQIIIMQTTRGIQNILEYFNQN